MPLILLAGVQGCGIDRLFDVLANHPRMFALRKDLCPSSLGLGVDKFGKMLALTVKLAKQGKTSRGDLQAACAAQYEANPCRTFLMGAKTMRELGPPAALLSACSKPGEAIKVQKFAPVDHAKVILVFRDPADLMWASYNTLTSDADRRRHPELGGSAQRDNYRSPEYFHELLLGGDRIAGGMPLTQSWLYSHFQVPDFYRIREVFGGSQNSLFLRVEDFDSEVVLSRLANFTGLSLSGFNKKFLGQGGGSGVQPAWVKEDDRGNYQISGFRPMLCKSRAMIYTASSKICGELQEQFGLTFPKCLHGDGRCEAPGAESLGHEERSSGAGVAVVLVVVAFCAAAAAGGVLWFKRCRKGDDDDAPRKIVLDLKGASPVGRLEDDDFGLVLPADEDAPLRDSFRSGAKRPGRAAEEERLAESSPGEDEDAPLVVLN